MKSLFYFRSRSLGRFAVIILAATPIFFSGRASAQRVLFERVTSNIADDTLALSARETHRVERFIHSVYPVRVMRRAVHRYDRPLLRKARYDLVKLYRTKYLIVAYVAEWDQFVHLFALYKLGPDGPVQVWRSEPWRANYYGLSFESVRASRRMLLLFKEGGLDPSGFSLSGVVTFRLAKDGVVLRDLTPRLPHLRALTNFPSHALYGRRVSLERSEQGEITLEASDEEFGFDNEQESPTNFWRYDARRDRLEAIASPIHQEPGREEGPEQTEPVHDEPGMNAPSSPEPAPTGPTHPAPITTSLMRSVK